jgi:hypothetical protein
MHLVGARGQQLRDFMYDASGTITTGGTAQLILPEHNFRTAVWLQNISDTAMYVEFGGARAHATLTSGVVTSLTIDNAGFGYTVPPDVIFYGGGDLTKNPNYLCPGLPGNVCPSTLAQAHAVLAAGAVSSFVIDNGGKNYVKAPYVFLRSSQQDPYGVAIPSATSGFELPANGTTPLMFDKTVCVTDAIAIFCASTGKAFTCKYTIGG